MTIRTVECTPAVDMPLGFDARKAVSAFGWTLSQGEQEGMPYRRAPGQIENVRQQYAALPFRYAGSTDILLITSRDTHRGSIPNGGPRKGRPPRGTAAREALQEAGIRGPIARTPIGRYVYLKRGLAGQRWVCNVDVFPLRVTVERDKWRERGERYRGWFPYRDAAQLVEEPDLASLILAFGGSLEGL